VYHRIVNVVYHKRCVVMCVVPAIGWILILTLSEFCSFGVGHLSQFEVTTRPLWWSAVIVPLPRGIMTKSTATSHLWLSAEMSARKLCHFFLPLTKFGAVWIGKFVLHGVDNVCWNVGQLDQSGSHGDCWVIELVISVFSFRERYIYMKTVITGFSQQHVLCFTFCF